MVKVLDFKLIRYSNLFNRVTRVRSNHCFLYNNMIIFVVPRKFIPQAIGFDNKNLKTLNELTKKRIKIVAVPNGREDIESFVSMITSPVKFKGIEIKENEAIITATLQNRASLIGRGKCRLNEMEGILGQYFGIRKVRVK